MAYDPCAEQVALHNIETCKAAIRHIDDEIEGLQAERGELDERLEHWREEAGKQRLAFEEEETRRQERATV